MFIIVFYFYMNPFWLVEYCTCRVELTSENCNNFILSKKHATVDLIKTTRKPPQKYSMLCSFTRTLALCVKCCGFESPLRQTKVVKTYIATISEVFFGGGGVKHLISQFMVGACTI